jgi:hypothetical protein
MKAAKALALLAHLVLALHGNLNPPPEAHRNERRVVVAK